MPDPNTTLGTRLAERVDQITTPRVVISGILAIVGLAAGIVELKPHHEAWSVTLAVVAVAVAVAVIVKVSRAIYLRRRSRRTKVALYRDVLSNLVEHDSHPFAESLEVEYHVGDDDDDDRVIRRATTQAASQSLHHRWVKERQPKPRNSAPVNPEDVNFVAVLPQKQPPRIVGLNSGTGEMKALVQFDPPLDGRAKKWSVEYAWPGMWTPLRTTGRDTAKFRLAEPEGSWRRLKITFAFPPGTKDACFLHKPTVGATRTYSEAAGRGPQLTWTVENPTVGSTFDFTVAAKITKRPRRLQNSV